MAVSAGDGEPDRAALYYDLGVGAALIAIGAAFLVEGWSLPPGLFEPIGPGPVPRAVAWFVVAAAAFVAGQAGWRLATGRLPRRSPLGYVPRPLDAWLVAVLTVAYVAAMGLGLAGFAGATLAFLVAAIWILARFDPRALPIAVPLGAVMGFGLDYLFTRVLVTDLP